MKNIAIPANDLRLGNWIIVAGHTIDYVQVDATIIEENAEHHFPCFQPIELTLDILVKAGFLKWNDPSKNYHLQINDGGTDGFRLDFDYMDGKMFLKSRYDQENLLVQRCNNIKYLHQLQNLYHALTGTELDIKL